MRLNINACISDTRIASQHIEMAIDETDDIGIKKELLYIKHKLDTLRNNINDCIDNETRPEDIDFSMEALLND